MDYLRDLRHAKQAIKHAALEDNENKKCFGRQLYTPNFAVDEIAIGKAEFKVKTLEYKVESVPRGTSIE